VLTQIKHQRKMAPIKTPMRLDISPLFLLCRLGAYLVDMRIFLCIPLYLYCLLVLSQARRLVSLLF
jgi:hypothetical protein